mmetsp:Transcript_5637/g.23892  ORF Transcript_5637/g.23892 Transcript_5637/m.23892 type:complete len:235 (+) Transcript_5637:2319-3023(+)
MAARVATPAIVRTTRRLHGRLPVRVAVVPGPLALLARRRYIRLRDAPLGAVRVRGPALALAAVRGVRVPHHTPPRDVVLGDGRAAPVRRVRRRVARAEKVGVRPRRARAVGEGARVAGVVAPVAAAEVAAVVAAVVLVAPVAEPRVVLADLRQTTQQPLAVVRARLLAEHAAVPVPQRRDGGVGVAAAPRREIDRVPRVRQARLARRRGAVRHGVLHAQRAVRRQEAAGASRLA